jgi:S-adenosylmethionine:tRNA ribosyltransferase-isomerase
MLIDDFDFELPPELIAQEPLPERDRSRMLVVERTSGSWRDDRFQNIATHLDPGDVIVINNTRVFPARLLGHRVVMTGDPGAAIETFLLTPLTSAVQVEQDGEAWEVVEWEVLARPGRALRPGAQLEFGAGRLRGEVIEIGDEGRRRIRFTARGRFDEVIDAIGQTPLPPYIKRETTATNRLVEPRYQTVYASERGAIAAPTAGLHFTPAIFETLRARGVEVVEITHHVGYATFQPVRVDRVEEHRIDAESYEIRPEAAARINQARQEGRRVVAIGTTSVRALESAANPDRTIRAERRRTELFIYPGYQFRAIDGLLTNFHLPKSSLLVLVAAFAGQETVLKAYRHAVDQRYRFYSYGDCMLLI